MRVASLYDIHSNLPALDAVLEDVRDAGVDRIVVGGDVIPGPFPLETIKRLTSLDVPVQFIRGNADREVYNRMLGRETASVPERLRPAIQWVADQVRPDFEAMIAGWPQTLTVDITGVGETLFCHATPRSDDEVFLRSTAVDKLLPVFKSVTATTVVCGHTHMQFDRTVGRIRVLNSGSVGMPYGKPGAHWLVLGREIQHKTTEYDLERAAEQIRASKYPQAEDYARTVLEPPTLDDMVKMLAQSELK